MGEGMHARVQNHIVLHFIFVRIDCKCATMEERKGSVVSLVAAMLCSTNPVGFSRSEMGHRAFVVPTIPRHRRAGR